MKILHYALGFPPYRTGGLTKFCVDLMCQQCQTGHQVAMMWPGQMGFVRKKTTVQNKGMVTFQGCRFFSFEVTNPLPVSYDEGIRCFDAFTENVDDKIYMEFLQQYHPDVIHIHTLMGLHEAFLSAAKKCGCRLVFTAHDFFPICPKVTIFRQGQICSSAMTCELCGICNATALSLKKIMLLQSPLYRKLKDSFWIQKVRKRHRDAYLSENCISDNVEGVGSAEAFQSLRRYYHSFLQQMDVIHYNSSITKAVYDSFFPMPQDYIISITHADISDHRVKKKFQDSVLRLRYLGPASGAKGFFLLKEALDKLWDKKHSFRLDVHFTPPDIPPYMNVHHRYQYNELQDIFQETDILIAPSIWYETFGYTILEALSYGVPVILSGTVGAKDILAEGAGIVIDQITADKLCDVLVQLTAEHLAQMNRVILEKQNIKVLAVMADEIERKCYLN